MFEPKLKEECGIMGGFLSKGQIAPLIKKGLFKLQHRGQEAAGICCGSVNQTVVKANGLVMDVLTDEKISSLDGNFAIGHVRYSTQGGEDSVNAQPLCAECMGEKVSIAHNGNVKEAKDYRDILCKEGETLRTTSDSEIILKKLCSKLKKKPSSWNADEIGKCLNEDFPNGAYSILLFLPKRIIAIRDVNGYRPLVFARTESGYFIASEDIALFDLKPLETVEIKAGQGVEITESGYNFFSYSDTKNLTQCVFEHIYFANPASTIFNKRVYDARLELGRMLAKDDKIEADVVIPVMDSGFIAALGYSFESKIPLELGLLRNKFVGRSFIAPDNKRRIQKVREKLIPIKSVIENKDIILIDDSLVRGVTSKEIIKILKDTGAKKVHLRIASAPITNTCFWGVDIPTKDELVCKNKNDIKSVQEETGADSIKYLSFESLEKCFGKYDWCYNCFL